MAHVGIDSLAELENEIINTMTHESSLSAELEDVARKRRSLLDRYFLKKYLVEDRTVLVDGKRIHVVEFQARSMDLNERPTVRGKKIKAWGIDRVVKSYENWYSPGEMDGGKNGNRADSEANSSSF